MHDCMYVNIYIYVYINKQICIYIYTYVNICVYIFICKYLYVYIKKYFNIYTVYMSLFTYINVYIYIYTDIFTYIYRFTMIYTYMYINIYLHIYLHTHTYIYIYTEKQLAKKNRRVCGASSWSEALFALVRHFLFSDEFVILVFPFFFVLDWSSMGKWQRTLFWFQYLRTQRIGKSNFKSQ